MSSLLLHGGRVIDPANRFDAAADVLLRDGKIAAVGAEAARQAEADVERVDVSGLVVCPGLIDLHVHLREPGQSAKETIATGTAAAARGGFTTVVCMPNTSPAIDNAGTVALIQEKALREGKVNVFLTGAITKGIEGEELAPIGSLKQAGVVAITDDGHCVQNNELMRRALEYARMFDLPIMDHCQDYNLVSDGVMHEGYWSTLLGLRGWPASGEDLIVARNILLAESTGAHVHCQHLSTAGSVELLRAARARGVPISGEACPHHFTLTDAAIAGSEKFWATDGAQLTGFDAASPNRPAWPSYDTNFKMNPPLRSARDREAILEGLADGTIEVLCSDHAPHCDYEKEVEFDYAPFGITGLENQLALALTQLYHTRRLGLPELLAKYTSAPARLLKLDRGTLSPGKPADVTVLDPAANWTYRRQESVSKSWNSPFDGWPMQGRALLTVVGERLSGVKKVASLASKARINGNQTSNHSPMQRILLTLVAAVAAFTLTARAELSWGTDLKAALEQAKKEKKLVVMDFTGSDWCGWCIKLNKEVFNTKEFGEYAAKNLVMVEVDFPNAKQQSAELKKANKALQEKYGANGFPTIVVLNGEGKEVWKQVGYMAGGPTAWIGKLDAAKKK